MVEGDQRYRFARGKGLGHERTLLEAEMFTNHWLSVAGYRALKRDWEWTWQSWVIRAIEYDPPEQP